MIRLAREIEGKRTNNRNKIPKPGVFPRRDFFLKVTLDPRAKTGPLRRFKESLLKFESGFSRDGSLRKKGEGLLDGLFGRALKFQLVGHTL